MVIQKGSNGEGKLQFFGRESNFTSSLCAKIHLRQTPDPVSHLSTLKFCQGAIKNELKETHSIIPKGHKIKPT